ARVVRHEREVVGARRVQDEAAVEVRVVVVEQQLGPGALTQVQAGLRRRVADADVPPGLDAQGLGEVRAGHDGVGPSGLQVERAPRPGVGAAAGITAGLGPDVVGDHRVLEADLTHSAGARGLYETDGVGGAAVGVHERARIRGADADVAGRSGARWI